MDLEHGESRFYELQDLSESEATLLSTVEATTIRVACHILGDNTSLIYTIL